LASGVRKGTEAKKIRDRHKGTDAQGFRCHTGRQAKNKGRSGDCGDTWLHMSGTFLLP